jgi:serine/threonine protein kinase
MSGDRTRSYDDKSNDVGSAPTDPATTTSGAPHAPVVRGDSFGRYTIRELIGAGGMGEVFAAHDPILNRMVALKMLKPSVAGASFEARARFEREAQAMARLNHPNVVSVFDVGEVGDRVFVAMELVDGPTLAKWLSDRPRGWREVVRVFVEAGRGLEAAHAVGIIHRDFKPSNVILGDRVRVADFGLARTAREPHAPSPASPDGPIDSTVTQSGQLVGTPAYMSPEQMAGASPTAASDQYSYCVALHEALFGARPGAPALRGDAPGWLRNVVQRGLELQPDARFPSMRHLLAELGRERKRSRRSVVVVVAGTAVAGLVVWSLRTPVPTPGPDLAPVVFAKEAADSSIRDIVISRDGAYLAYLMQTGIMVEPRAGGPRSTLSPPPGLGALESIALSRTGDKVFAAFMTQGTREIWALDVTGGRRERRVPPASAPDFRIHAAWDVGPDGSLFVIPGRDEDPYVRLARVDTAGALRMLADSNGMLGRPSVSMDGARVAIVESRDGVASVNVVDVANRTPTVVVRHNCRQVDWFGPRSLACVEARDGASALVELTLPDGPGEMRARDRFVSPMLTALVRVRGTSTGIFLRAWSLEQRLCTIDLERGGQLSMPATGSITDVAPAGWTASGSLIFGANMHGRLQIMALRPDDRIDVVRGGPTAEVPLAVLGETIVFGQFPGGENLIPRGDITYGRVYPPRGELFRLGPDGNAVALGAASNFLALRCAGDRAPPCLLMEKSGDDAYAVRWDPESGVRGQVVARWSLSKDGFHALAPDGRTLVHVSFGDSPGTGKVIELVDLEGGGSRRLLPGDWFRNLTWQPDGTLLGVRAVLPMGVYRIRERSIEEVWSARGDAWLFEPSVSPDGKKLAIARAEIPVTYSWASYEQPQR